MILTRFMAEVIEVVKNKDMIKGRGMLLGGFEDIRNKRNMQ